MTIYEYQTVPLAERPALQPPTTVADTLNEQARQGWRLVAVLENRPGAPLGVMERELPRDRELTLAGS